MKTVVVLGGCGAVGSVAVRTLATQPAFGRVVIADQQASRGRELVAALGSERVAFVTFDAGDAASVHAAVAGADIVLNCVGPFYKTVKTVLGAVIDAGIDYVDICDDVDVTVDIIELDAAARAAGVRALIGMGASPGVTNVLARLVHDQLLDETDSIDIFHTHGGEPTEGPGVIGHRFHCMTIDIPMFLDGELRHVRYFGPDGIALRQTFDFPRIGKNIPLFPYPHPEQVTIPRFLRVRRVTNKGSVLPIEYYQLTAELCRLGLSSRAPVDVNGTPVVPYDFTVAYLIRERARILRETGFGQQRGCVSVVVAGVKDGKRREYRLHMASTSRALGEGTGIPAAMGVMLMAEGKIARTGVLPPEAAVEPMDFVALWRALEGQAEHAERDGAPTMLIERVDEHGTVETINL